MVSGRVGDSVSAAAFFLRVVLRQVAYRPWRTLAMLVALSATLAVVLVLEGFRNGIDRQLSDAVLGRGSPLIATQAGIDNFLAVHSNIPQQARLRVEALPGIVSVAPLTLVPVIFERGGSTTPIVLIVTDGAGGPRTLAAGDGTLGDRRIVIDISLAQEFDLDVGDTVDLNGYAFVVSGIAIGESAFFTPFAFIDYDDLIDWFWALDVGADITSFPLVSFLLITPSEGLELREAARRIEVAEPSIDVFDASALAANDVRLGRDLLDPVLGVLLGVAWVMAVGVIGIIMFTVVQARLHDHVVMHAVGGRRRTTVVLLVSESLLLMILALSPAIGIALFAADMVNTLAPVYRVVPLQAETLARLLSGAVLAALVGATAPLTLIARIDPGAALRR